MSCTRREAVAGAIAAAALVVGGGASAAFGNTGESLLRPPGGQDAQRLLGLCLRCDRCRSVCPHSAIDIAHIEDGLLVARTPKMNFHLGYCDFCNGDYLCARVCPSQAISFGFDPITDKIGLARVDHEQCLLDRLAGACSLECVDACPYEALVVDEDGKLKVIDDLCNGCGLCEYSCPSASYATYTGSTQRGINIKSLSALDTDTETEEPHEEA